MKRLIPLLLAITALSCGKDKDKTAETSEVLSQNACLKKGEYCYVPKAGLGFTENSCKEGGGVIVLTCDPDPSLSCEKESLTISLYGDAARGLTCDDVGTDL